MPNEERGKKQGGLFGRLARALSSQSTNEEKRLEAEAKPAAAQATGLRPVRRTAGGLVIARPESLVELLSMPEPPPHIWWEEAEMELCRVQAGEFIMGGAAERAEPEEKPQHRVYLDTYYVGRYPVTNAQYARFVQATGHAVPPVKLGLPASWQWDPVGKTPPEGEEDHPVGLVTWHDAVAYCRWAGLRLPTEAEWEKAARGTDQRNYPWGNEWDANRCNSLNREEGTGTTPVGAYSPAGDSPYGCADMAGNVREWVADWFSYEYYALSGYHNPKGPLNGRHKVTRGGNCDSDWGDVIVWRRHGWRPDSDNETIGFRCAVSPGE